jgi:hypothetical protein
MLTDYREAALPRLLEIGEVARDPRCAVTGDFMVIRFLAALPFLGILVGAIFLNRVEPLVLGLPLLLAWLLMWIVLTSLIMAIVYLLDPANRAP